MANLSYQLESLAESALRNVVLTLYSRLCEFLQNFAGKKGAFYLSVV